jgi:hypothetical protein
LVERDLIIKEETLIAGNQQLAFFYGFGDKESNNPITSA